MIASGQDGAEGISVLRRRILHIGVIIGLVMAAVFGTGTAAQAAPTSFAARAIHGGGAGATAISVTGDLHWANRSVTLSNLKVHALPGECGSFVVWGYQGNTEVDLDIRPETAAEFYCGGGSSGTWHYPWNIVLDGSHIQGGITRVRVRAVDDSHAIFGYANCLRSSSSCTQSST